MTVASLTVEDYCRKTWW